MNKIKISDEDEVEEETDETPAQKSRKVERASGRRSKRSLPVYESEGEDDEHEIRKSSKRSSRKDTRRSRRSSVEQNGFDSEEDHDRSSRRSSRKVEKKDERRSKRSLDSYFDTATLSSLLDDLIKNKNSWAFTSPVSKKEAPDYHILIKNPMDLGTIKSRLNMGYYKSNAQMINDIEQIFINCDIYNEPGTDTYL